MSFEWNVQPYRWVSELRETYTTAVIVATRYDARNIAPEIESWMKQNAPWKDRDIYKWVGEGENRRKVLRFAAGNARKNLRAEVLVGEQEEDEYRRGYAAAAAADRKLLKELNAQRRKGITEIAQGDTTKRLRGGVSLPRTEGEFKALMLSKVPKSKSAVVAFQAAWKARPGDLIVQIRMRHGSRTHVPYAIWLEVANQGRYGIISRAVAYWGSKFMSRLRSTINLIQFRHISLGEVVSPEQQFQAHMEREIAAGENYQPFTPEVRAEKKRRRGYRNRSRSNR